MSERKILDMLDAGQISADDAARLLDAISSEPAADEQSEEDAAPAAGDADEVLPGTLDAVAARWRRYQWIPFAISVSVLLIASWGMWEVHRAAGGRITFGWVVLLLVVLASLGATVLSAWIVNAPWLHVRISGSDGKRLAISMPIPLGLLDWGLRIAERFAGEDVSPYLGASAEMLHSMRQAGGARQPFDIRVDEGDERVQVYIG